MFNLIKKWTNSKIKKDDVKNVQDEAPNKWAIQNLNDPPKLSWEDFLAKHIKNKPPKPVNAKGQVMDGVNQFTGSFNAFNPGVQADLLAWYGTQSFIGYQLAAILAQNWLIDKACTMPGKDAIRKGYEITANAGGFEITPQILDYIRKKDKEFRITLNLEQFIKMGRVFGIRIAIFNVISPDPQYYEKPFNINGILPGSYKGITQVDPFWITPELDINASGNPASEFFYEPTWWRVNGIRYHRTHLLIFKNGEVADILKPTYFYGGIPIPQKIYERVYAAERTANEAPMLALTKRTTIVKVDMANALAKQCEFEQRMALNAAYRNNYGFLTIDHADEVQQFDVSLTDLDSVIMTQYQIVSAAANVPAVKLLGTSPKGFNTTGEFEEANYHEELESIQTHDLSPFLQRHYALLIKSEVCPEFKIPYFDIEIAWNSLDAMTAREVAELNKIKAETAEKLSSIGALDGFDERSRIVNDKDSGYNGLELGTREEMEFEEEQDAQNELEILEEKSSDIPNEEK